MGRRVKVVNFSQKAILRVLLTVIFVFIEYISILIMYHLHFI